MDEEGESNLEVSQNQSPAEPELLLQWGNRKRLRRVKMKETDDGKLEKERSDGLRRIKVRVNRRMIRSGRGSSLPSAWMLPRKSESLDKEDVRFYTTRGSMAGHVDGASMEERGLPLGCGVGEEKARGRWIPPRFFISLSSKEKEEDFMTMKGCKLPQRPKKRAKFMQKTILLVSPGAGLADVSHERYEVREKKSSRKRRRGLKAISLETDSD
ncbi:uncharacterized protein LOC144701987 isoform X2 [Wolffia australiana]